MTHRLHKTWLKVSAVVIGFGGPLLTLSTMPGLTEPARWGLDLLSFPLDGFPSYASDEIRFLSALTGGFLVGWAVLVWGLSGRIYDLAPDAVRRAYLTATFAWFVTDSTGSITSGYWPNAVWNILILLILIGPLWRPAPQETLA